MLLTRRGLTMMAAGSLAGGLAARLLTMPAMALALPRAASFDVLLGKKRIGRHAIAFTAQGEGFRAATTIDLTVKVAFFTVLDLHHQSEELWQGGRLTRMRSTTRDGKDRFEVAADAGPEGIRCISPAGTIIMPPETYTSNGIWGVGALRGNQLIDAQNGGIIGLAADGLGQEQVKVAGRALLAERYRFATPGAAGDLWYADAELVKGRLEVRGETVDYLRVA